MSRHSMGFRAALSAAKDSELRAHRVGAVIMKGKSIVSIGRNVKKTHPNCPTNYSQHAEFNAAIGLDSYANHSGLTIYIARLTRTGKIGISKPCEFCERLLINLGIHRVVFSNDDGNMEFLKWN